MFNFSYRHMEWALPYLLEMQNGEWPPMPDNYIWEITMQSQTDPEAQKILEKTIEEIQEYAVLMRRGGHVPAKFEKAVEIASVIDERLDNCSKDGCRDGLMVKDFYVFRKTHKEMHLTYNLDISEILDRIDRAMTYISGWKAKGNYKDWYKNKGRACKSSCDIKDYTTDSVPKEND